jgi:hypothetical protein
MQRFFGGRCAVFGHWRLPAHPALTSTSEVHGLRCSSFSADFSSREQTRRPFSLDLFT